MPVNKVTKNFEAQRVNSDTFVTTLTQLQSVGNRGKEWIAVQSTKGAGKGEELKPVLVNKVCWLGRLFQRICGKNQNTRLNNVSNFLINYLKANERTLTSLNDTQFQQVNESLILLKKHFMKKSPELKNKIDEIISNRIQIKSYTPTQEVPDKVDTFNEKSLEIEARKAEDKDLVDQAHKINELTLEKRSLIASHAGELNRLRDEHSKESKDYKEQIASHKEQELKLNEEMAKLREKIGKLKAEKAELKKKSKSNVAATSSAPTLLPAPEVPPVVKEQVKPLRQSPPKANDDATHSSSVPSAAANPPSQLPTPPDVAVVKEQVKPFPVALKAAAADSLTSSPAALGTPQPVASAEPKTNSAEKEEERLARTLRRSGKGLNAAAQPQS